MSSNAPSFELLKHPIVFTPLELIDPASAWIEHTPFAFLLMELLRPKALVELGTHTGVSYCAFCQAASLLKLPIRAWGLDTWQGDTHTGEYSNQVLPRLRANHDPKYSSFSTLLQSTFDDALPQFEDGSIDLLHVDGLHTYEAVKHDFETWKPKLSESAVVLFHDSAEVQQDFGVHQLWAEISSQFPSFEFKHAHGLGVLAVGGRCPQPVLEFLTFAKANTDLIRTCFATIGKKHSLRAIASCLYTQQVMVNQWKRQTRTGTVHPESDKLARAQMSPVPYAMYAMKEVKALIRSVGDQPKPG